MSYEVADEFNTKVKHNFKLYVLLTSRNIHWRQEYILETIYGLNGYKCHKTVKYEAVKSSHIQVKFEEEYMAKEAVDFLINLNSDLTAVLVDDMLREWYNFEKNCGFITPWTITVVDITGDPPFGLNFLTEAILHSIFRDFCNPYVLPYTAALNEPHVQIMFGSMTEALAASMAFGEWYVRDRKMDSFFYRVRIHPSDKESMLISHSGGDPDQAFKLDYFVNLRNESGLMINEQSTKQKMYDFLHNKGLKKTQKQKLAAVNIDPNQNRVNVPTTNGNSIICVPIIAPFNSYAQALMASNKRMNEGVTNDIPNFPRTQNVKGTDEVDCWPSTEVENTVFCQSSVQAVNTKESSKNDVTFEQNILDEIVDSVKEKPDLIPPVITMKQRRKVINFRKAHLKVHGNK